MKIPVLLLLVIILVFVFTTAGEVKAQISMDGDVLNEVPVWPVPQEMTLEEYTDANRRLSVGLMLMSVPFPGALHFYAGDRKEGWMHVGAAAAGVLLIVSGAGMIDEKETWEETDYEWTDITNADGEMKRYRKIPLEEERGVVKYRLEEMRHESDGAGGLFIVLGAGLLIGELFHDWYDGVRTIEKKRNAVRFKYGKKAKFGLSLAPKIDLDTRRMEAGISLAF